MLGTVYHIGYLTDDVDQAVDFYKRTFGGEVAGQTTGADGGKIVYVKAGDSEVELIQPADRSRLGGKTGLVLDHVGYFVSDLDQAIADLKAKGLKLASEPTVSAVGYRMCYLDASSTLGTRMHLTEIKK